jgi:hypothetical protein
LVGSRATCCHCSQAGHHAHPLHAHARRVRALRRLTHLSSHPLLCAPSPDEEKIRKSPRPRPQVPLLPVDSFVILQHRRASNVTTAATDAAHAPSTIHATGASRRPRHGHAEATSWPPPRPASPAYKRRLRPHRRTHPTPLSLPDTLAHPLSL